MSQQLAIDANRFARESRHLEGVLEVADLSRLHDLLAGISGQVVFRLQGLLGERGQPRLRLEVSGVLPLVCQRCLGAVNEQLEIDALLEVVSEGTEPTQEELEDDSLDFLPVAGALDVKALVEDEILLALPVAPRHEACALPSGAESDERLNPFSALASLKGRLN